MQTKIASGAGSNDTVDNQSVQQSGGKYIGQIYMHTYRSICLDVNRCVESTVRCELMATNILVEIARHATVFI